jgi:NADPH:quinone reductase-like Zn-dependent oxidoreductase
MCCGSSSPRYRAGARRCSSSRRPNREDLSTLSELIEAGQIRPVIERRYELDEIAEAMRAMSDGHARAKIVVTV